VRPGFLTDPQTSQIVGLRRLASRGGKIRLEADAGLQTRRHHLPIMFLLASLGGVLTGVPFQSLIG